MKRTDLEKKERELKKQQKKIDKIESIRNNSIENMSESGAINNLFNLFQFDEVEIYNIPGSEDILEFLLMIQEIFSEKIFSNIIKKSIKKTKIKNKQEALLQIKNLLN